VTPEARDTISWVLGTIIALCFLAGLATKRILLPYLQEHLGLVRETHAQVTENHHASPEQPTLVDRVDDVARDVRALARVMDEHMDWSDRYRKLTDRKLKALRKVVQRHLANGGPSDDQQDSST
jgi:hypothetical protein